MDALSQETAISRVAGAIAEPARTRMLCSLMDGRARTSTELAAIAEVSASTASAHLGRLQEGRLIRCHTQGRHRYFSLVDVQVAQALEALMVISQGTQVPFVPNTPARLRFARTCYDHMAGTLAVQLHDHFVEAGWLGVPAEQDGEYQLALCGEAAFAQLGIDVAQAKAQRRRFACPCLDWSMRRPHLAGALGAALLHTALRQGWLVQDLDSRALALTPQGRRALHTRIGLKVASSEPDVISSPRPSADRTTRA
ncbi:ArsR/SmtB family transcription factor [Pseudomonas sp. KNUC1026]|uniref:ArsR/SmtB family transcription factor n=1 Tax=Pseudomonas sp. KNUC1026 TaxID=2893890 RepID=UPI001F1D5801|nr:winged helix-turn-helix domain-containing protein [Pseudomonas sp. KNUC1026]UFH50907.1 winged helix-turn-helix domain-containing protein [Pseudomonas sp. KNUC1026]